MTEESSSSTLPVPPQPPPPPPIPSPSIQSKQHRMNPLEMRNSDLVNRFLAATPPYLYSPPIGPPNFFFSEMLRSLVQAKANEQNARNLSNQMRRPRKRLWTQNRFDATESDLSSTASYSKECNDLQTYALLDRTVTDKPLELTNKPHPAIFPNLLSHTMSSKVPKLESRKNSVTLEQQHVMQSNSPDVNDSKVIHDPPSKLPRNILTPQENENLSNEPSTASLTPSDLVLPPVPSMWYPPLYPPYGIDPLHFFIDLRVSGHIYDRKKENGSPKTSNMPSENNNSLLARNSNLEKMNGNQFIGKSRHGSAFSVPPPRRDQSPLALNLSSSMAAVGKAHSIDYSNNSNNSCLDADENSNLSKNTNYVLQNLPRIYTSLTHHTKSEGTGGGDDRHSLQSEETESKSGSDIDVKDHEQTSNLSDDVVIVDHDSADNMLAERKFVRQCDKM